MEQKEIIKENRSRPKVSIVNKRMWLLVALGFVMLCILTWLNEVLDLPYLLTGGIKTHFNWLEAIVETVLIIIVGLFTVSVVIRSIAENKKKEKLLLKYHDELEIRVNEQTAELLRVNEELRIDITQRKRAEEGLVKERNLLRTVIDNLPDYVYIKDTSGRYIVSNIAHARFLGVTTPTEVVGKTAFELFPREMAEQYAADDQKIIQTGKSLLDREERSVDQTGNKVWNLTTKVPLRDSSGKIVGLVGIARDITKRKQVEEALRESEERYSLAQRAANIGSWDWDILTGNLEWSEEIEPMFGFGRGEFGGTYEAFLECVHPEDQQHVVDSVNACIEKGRNYDIEHRIIWPDGIVHWVLEAGNVVRDKNNKAIRMLGIVKDITERKHADEVLKRDKETFEKLVSEKTHELFKTQAELDKAKRLSDLGILAATVAHELRNPLGVIKIAAYNIRKKRENSLLDKHLDNIEKKVLESGQIINNLLNYSRIKIPSYEKIQIYDILNECITFTKRRFHKQNVSIVKKFKSRKKKLIEADPLQIREIFNNVLTNAYQSVSNKKGKIEISERDDGKGSIEIIFKDNGMGIDKEDLERVFEPFFTRKSKGTGLGLTICNELVNLHSGRIDINSKKGKGTSVTVSLPIKRETK